MYVEINLEGEPHSLGSVDHVADLHTRAASRICYHSQETLLLSGGKDGMCKLFVSKSWSFL